MAEKVDLLSGSKPIPLDVLQPVRRRVPSMQESPLSASPQPAPLPPISPGQPSAPPVMPPSFAGVVPDYFGARAPRVPSARPTRVEVARKYKTLEEMYSYHSGDLNEQGAVLRVERIDPAKAFDFEGKRFNVSGILSLENRPLSTPEFARKFGGRKYHVYLQVPTPQDTPSGHPRMTDRAFCEFEIPGEPNLESLPIIEEGYMFQNTPFGRRVMGGQYNGGGGMQQQVQPQRSDDSVRAVLDFAGNVIRSPQQAQTQMPSGAFEALQGTSNAAIDTARTMASQQVQMLISQMEDLRKENSRLQQALMEDKHRPTEPVEMIKAFAALNASSRTSASSDELELLRRQHREELELVRRQHQDELANQNRFSEQMAKSQRDTFEGQIRNLEQRMNDLRADHERREQSIRDESERRERDAKRDAESKATMIQLQLEARLKDQADMYERERRQSEKTHEFTSRNEEKLNSTQLAMLQQELNKMQGELNQAKAEVDQARAERNKSLPQMLAEHQEIGATLANVVGPTTPEGGSLAERAVDGLMKVAPQLIGALGAHIKPGGAAPAAPGVQQHAPAQLTQGSAPGRQAARRGPPRMVFYEDDVAASGGFPAQERYQPMYAPVMAPQPPVAPPPVQHMPIVQQQPQMPPPAPMSMVAPASSPQMVAPPSPPASASSETPPWQGLDWIGLSEDQLSNLFGGLEAAYSERKSPEQVAQELVSGIGPEGTKMLASIIDIDRLIEGIRTAPMTAQTGLSTNKGRSFVRHVWENVLKIAQSL